MSRWHAGTSQQLPGICFSWLSKFCTLRCLGVMLGALAEAPRRSVSKLKNAWWSFLSQRRGALPNLRCAQKHCFPQLVTAKSERATPPPSTGSEFQEHPSRAQHRSWHARICRRGVAPHLLLVVFEGLLDLVHLPRQLQERAAAANHDALLHCSLQTHRNESASNPLPALLMHSAHLTPMVAPLRAWCAANTQGQTWTDNQRAAYGTRSKQCIEVHFSGTVTLTTALQEMHFRERNACVAHDW